MSTENLEINQIVADVAQTAPQSQAKLTEFFAEDLIGYLQAIKKLSNTSGATWFRGQSKRSYHLEPGLYRHPAIKGLSNSHSKAAELESKLMERFKNHSVPYVGHKFVHEDEWAQLFFMQHYRVPTRLLDWSYSPLVALHFALSGATSKPDSSDAACAVWTLHPETWNGAALSHQSAPSKIYGTDSDEIKPYKAGAAFKLQTADAIAIEGIHNSPRIVAQQGAFTIFGPTTSPMEEQFKSNAYPNASLGVITIKSEHVQGMTKELIDAGILETTIYPDLEGLACRLKRELSFGA
ncbi:FRG domain-containing protein [Acidovorax sp. 93]|uniref:FRG domain-containing protein n=1 Tax=Acidovorax sp. 93 TaxID=2135632 RepID=UPI000EB60CD2|nr:FRG domain-containing protein [Acidovorax sp. 93]RKR27098.1 FRG domain-containing protein [Acidovorax sp. 93]